MEINEYLKKIGEAAKNAAVSFSVLGTDVKNNALLAVADALENNMQDVLESNRRDYERAGEKGIGPALLDRLRLDEKRMGDIIRDIRKVASLDDPVGSVIDSRVLPNGLSLTRKRIPIGVIGVIYEARPNVTADIASLCIKTGNVCILRGGSETIETNQVMIKYVRQGLSCAGVSPEVVQFIDNTDRELVAEFLRMDQYIDMIIPRGGSRLSALCRAESTIPVIIGGFGISHIFVDETADLKRSIPVIMNSKVQKPSACNALDTLLVHRSIADKLFEILVPELNCNGISVAADEEAFEMLQKLDCKKLERADEKTFDTEWLSMAMGIRIVSDIDEALDHMHQHNASHSDSILTNSLNHSEKFVNCAGSAAAYVNASTRFTDGGQFGLGAEVAISTQKLHARGPMGLEELTTYKWICSGDYLVRS